MKTIITAAFLVLSFSPSLSAKEITFNFCPLQWEYHYNGGVIRHLLNANPGGENGQNTTLLLWMPSQPNGHQLDIGQSGPNTIVNLVIPYDADLYNYLPLRKLAVATIVYDEAYPLRTSDVYLHSLNEDCNK